MTEARKYEAERPTESPEVEPQVMSVRRILREWSFADDSPLDEDDLDRIINIAAVQVRRRS